MLRLDLYWQRGTGDEVQIGTLSNLIQGGVYAIIVQRPLNGTTSNDANVIITLCILS